MNRTALSARRLAIRLAVFAVAWTTYCTAIDEALAPRAFAADAQVQRETVTGIGGFFFRAADPAQLAAWYAEHLGVTPVPTSYEQTPWTQAAGPTVFAPFEQDSAYFGNADKVWMMNFRVRSLDAMVAQLRASGIEVDVDPEIYPNGRFARLVDPEGNPIQLWEPPSP